MYSQEHPIICSSDEETVVPLKLIRSNLLMLPEPPEDPNSYEELYKYSMEKCEFCDSIFHCRYDVIIHNAKHIIVPLINQNTFKCDVCLHVFTTKWELNNHKYYKHNPSKPPVIQRSIRKEAVVKNDVPNVLENFVMNEPIVKCVDGVKPPVKISETVATSSILKSRLVFEDDPVDDIICIDDDEEPPHMNGPIIENSVNNRILDIVNNKLEKTLNGVCPKKETHPSKETQNVTPKLKILLPSEVNLEKLTPSVHYEQLLKPGLYRCKRCTKTFPNRYTLIIHETSHLKFKKQIRSRLCTLCDRHIAGSRVVFNKHMKLFHSLADLSRNYIVSVCTQCNLKFHNSKRHAQLYHCMLECNNCSKRFLNNIDLTTHYNECKKSFPEPVPKSDADNALQKKALPTENEDSFDILRVCEVCALFLKDNQRLKYVCVGENSKLECNQVCEQCNKEAYVIKLIKRVRTNTKFKGQYKVRLLSNNENRLKNIQQRLKFMNKLSRF